jgi:DNA modification methylase
MPLVKKPEKIWSGGIKNDNLDDFGGWLKSVYQTVDLIMGEGCAIYIWHPSGEDGKYFWNSWPFDEWHFQVDIVWNKLSLIISRWDYKPQHEPCMYGWKGKNRKWCGPNNMSTIWDHARQQGNSGEKREHPTQKPVVLPETAIKNHSVGIVFDPFGGSGSTLIACEKTNRNCRMMELDEQYCDVIVKRWQEFTGKEATLESTDETFNSLIYKREAA